MTHDQIVAALRRGYQLDDARESRRGCYPIRKPSPRTTVRRMRDDPPPFGTSDPTGFGQRVQRRTGNAVRFVFRHFRVTELHPHALAAAAAAEAAALQYQFWAMHALLFHCQNALADDYLRRYAAKLGLDVVRFDRDRTGAAVLEVLAPRLRAS